MEEAEKNPVNSHRDQSATDHKVLKTWECGVCGQTRVGYTNEVQFRMHIEVIWWVKIAVVSS